MAPSRLDARSRWIGSAVAGVLVVAVFFAMFRTPRVGPEKRSRFPAPDIRLSIGSAEELTLRSLKPLFLPTPYNAVPREPSLEPGHAYFDADPGIHLFFNPSSPQLKMPAAFSAPSTPAAVVTGQPDPNPVALGIGRKDAGLPRQPPHGAYIEVVAEGTGNLVFDRTLPSEAAPPTEAGSATEWRPLEMTVLIDSPGLAGAPVLTISSGFPRVDEHFLEYLRKDFRLGDRLMPGFYRIVVAP